MSKFVKLLTSAYVNGQLRHPHEGALHLEDDEAKRLIDNQAAVDVTGDFSADQKKDTPVESLDASTDAAKAALTLGATDHQANLPVADAEAAKPKKETVK